MLQFSSFSWFWKIWFLSLWWDEFLSARIPKALRHIWSQTHTLKTYQVNYRSINNKTPLKVWAGGPKSENLSLLLLSQEIFACGAAFIISNFQSPKIDLRKSWFLDKKTCFALKTPKKFRLRRANNTPALIISKKNFACGAAFIIFHFQNPKNLICSYYLSKKGGFIINRSVL